MNEDSEIERDVLLSVFPTECKLIGSTDLDHLIAADGSERSVIVEGGQDLGLAEVFEVLRSALSAVRQVKTIVREYFPGDKLTEVEIEKIVKGEKIKIKIKTDNEKIINMMSALLPKIGTETVKQITVRRRK